MKPTIHTQQQFSKTKYIVVNQQKTPCIDMILVKNLKKVLHKGMIKAINPQHK